MLRPPTITNDGHRIIRTDYFQDGFPMRLSGLSWLDCHLGYLRLLNATPGDHTQLQRWSFSDFAILTRGKGREDVEMLEFHFPSMPEERNPAPLYLHPWQCNRLPSWTPGKRCWELEIYCGDDHDQSALRVYFSRRVFYREARIPCRQWWTGPRQDGRPQPVPRKLTPEEDAARLLAVKNSRHRP